MSERREISLRWSVIKVKSFPLLQIYANPTVSELRHTGLQLDIKQLLALCQNFDNSGYSTLVAEPISQQKNHQVPTATQQ
ncbi:hypothetical protein C8R31_103325 [Nitrosospira sp. Nsp2]|nr:hypothetical protein C8R31_103325 [Nitrosospira sp. Nsp2]